MGQKLFKIAVGMPVYNGEPYLEQAIRSVLRQTFDDFQLIISDNASTDRTGEVCRDYALKDQRIFYTRNKVNIGAANNYNHVFRLSKSPYFRWFNSDDLCDEKLHQKCFDVMKDNPEVVLAYGQTCLIDENGEIKSFYRDNLNLQQDKPVDRYIAYHYSVGLTNSIYGLIRAPELGNTMLMGDGSYGADINIVAELSLYGKFYEIPEILFYRRIHQKSSSALRSNKSLQHEFWNAKTNSWTFPKWKENLAAGRGILNAPILPSAKIKLILFLLKKLRYMKIELAQELIEEVKIGFYKNRI